MTTSSKLDYSFIVHNKDWVISYLPEHMFCDGAGLMLMN